MITIFFASLIALLCTSMRGARSQVIEVNVLKACTSALLTSKTVLQLGSMVAGATGIWERVGNGWQVSSLGYSLKKLATDGVQASEGNIHGGLMRLPLRLAFIGHENTCQSVKAFQQTRAGMRETASQVR